jgi:hypothetical protein
MTDDTQKRFSTPDRSNFRLAQNIFQFVSFKSLGVKDLSLEMSFSPFLVSAVAGLVLEAFRIDPATREHADGTRRMPN